MKALVQRVRRAEVRVVGDGPPEADGGRAPAALGELDERVVGAIGAGLCVLVGVTHADTEAEARKLADKIWGLRIMNDDEGAMNRSVADVDGEILVVSQFTLYGDTRKGRRPSWVDAARPEQAEPLIDVMVDRLRDHGAVVATGRFRAYMVVDIVNDGPVTVMVEVPPASGGKSRSH